MATSSDHLLPEELPSRFVVGIDLGTTNSSVAYVDTHEPPWQVRTFAIPQLVAPAQVEARDVLPSFVYQPAKHEFAASALRLPWHRQDPPDAVGILARDYGAQNPSRLVISAKSWLCHSGVDRTAPLLPWHGAEDVERLSPVDANARYLKHIRDAWNHRHPTEPLEQQDIVLTLPASFDEVARELTVAAAAAANLPRIVLIEEPQAAFYAWIYKHSGEWQEHVTPGQTILVCDIGGGTSDFTLIRARAAGDAGAERGRVQFLRVAVGEHLLIGGDNFDLALARFVEERLGPGKSLEPRQWDALVRSCRKAKETLLSEPAPERLTVTIPGGGSRLIGGATQIEVTREEVRELLLSGFFPQVDLEDKPLRHRSGFQEFGLPYSADPAVTRHLAAFLTSHREVIAQQDDASAAHDPARPDVVLFNGGVFAASLLQERLVAALCGWFPTRDGTWKPQVLAGDRLDLAVARGAAYYGMVLRGEGVRIGGGLARTYYIGIESDPPAALCLMPARAEPGEEIDLTEHRFELLVSQPAEFQLYVSSTRLTDEPGRLMPVDAEQMTALPPIRTALQTRKRERAATVAIHLHARLTEIGTLELWCSEIDGPRRWRLQFDIRSATQTDVAAHEGAGESAGILDEETWQSCRERIADVFGESGHEKPEMLVRRLGETLQSDRGDWPPSLLRRIWETLMEFEPGRRKSVKHEARWLNLLGYALRPGYGVAVDDWRVAETWRMLQGKLVHAAPICRTESWILWRRVAGGLSAGQQRAVAEPLLATLRSLQRRYSGKGGGSDLAIAPQDTIEMWRLLGALELLEQRTKIEIGRLLGELMAKRKLSPAHPAMIWALGRIGTRVPMYGPLNTVVRAEEAARWLSKLMETEGDRAARLLAVMQLARKTDDRHRDINEPMRQQVLQWMQAQEAPRHFRQLVTEGGWLEAEEQDRVFGEALPKGLRQVQSV